MIQVTNAGLYTTIQDLGRYGYFSYGVPASGVVDYRSHILANTLVGNDNNTPTIEMTYIGASFIVKKPTELAVVGADMEFNVNDHPMPTGVVIQLNQDDIITFKKAIKGMRTYIAISGGFQTSKFLDSYSTHEKINVGKRLQVGDIIECGKRSINEQNQRLKKITTNNEIRIIPGQQFDYFNEENIRKLTTSNYKISDKWDRMGLRLEGEILKSCKGYDILSEPTLLGSIQVPADGQPIILLNERQTIGGYPKIATVIKADIPKIAQIQPSEYFTFKLISLREAKELYTELMTKLNDKEFIETLKMDRNNTTKKISKILER